MEERGKEHDTTAIIWGEEGTVLPKEVRIEGGNVTKLVGEEIWCGPGWGETAIWVCNPQHMNHTKPSRKHTSHRSLSHRIITNLTLDSSARKNCFWRRPLWFRHSKATKATENVTWKCEIGKWKKVNTKTNGAVTLLSSLLILCGIDLSRLRSCGSYVADCIHRKWRHEASVFWAYVPSCYNYNLLGIYIQRVPHWWYHYG